MTEEELFQRFRPHAAHRGGVEIHLDRLWSVRFIEACRENDFAVIRTEGFIHDAARDWIYPKTSLIVDETSISSPLWRENTWAAFKDGCNDDIQQFIEDLDFDRSYIFCFVIWSQQGWQQAKQQPEEIIETAGGRTLRFSPSILKQLSGRGWTKEDVVDAVNDPQRIVPGFEVNDLP